jgi:predicted Zn-ribbon and HTH transcriptional regulator
MAEPSAPESRAETIRESLKRVLREGPTTLRELSGAVSVSEKDIATHLEHLERSLRRGDERLVIEPAKCLACGFEFADRKRASRPSRCPECRGNRIAFPRFSITR